MKEISAEARGSPERKEACSFSSSMRPRRLEGSPQKGLFKRAPRIQSPCFSQTSDHFQPSGDVRVCPCPALPSLDSRICDDLNGITWKVRLDLGSALGTPGGRCSLRLYSQPQGLDVCKCWDHQARDNSGLNPPQEREGESPGSHPSPLLKPQNEGLPAPAGDSSKWSWGRRLRRLGGNSTSALAQPGAGRLGGNILVFQNENRNKGVGSDRVVLAARDIYM